MTNRPTPDLITPAVLDSLGSGLLCADRDGTVLVWNRSAEETTGVSGIEILGRRLTDAPGLKALAELVTRTGRSGQGETRVEVTIEVDGVTVPLGVTTNPVREARGRVTAVVANFRDISEVNFLKTQAMRQDRLAVLGKVAANLAHEIRNPLAVIRGNAEMLLRTPAASALKHVEPILVESDRINRLINDILNYSKEPALTLKPTDLVGLIRETVAKVKDRSRRIRFILPKQRRLLARLDPWQMTQVLENLLINAVEAVKADGRIRLELRRRRSNVELRIADNGCGIKPDNIPKVFIPFFTTKGFHGTGLGLAICERIVTAHGGGIELESVPAKGTTVIVTLPKK